ncbi:MULTISPECIES: nitrilase-related carbon-nitrogen hydrolase [Psychrilyobacter]|uniref:Nitrilase n=1 Tax=Psychrilyobacter piezotolerans TaxID=2293438 RepID=A0ABX9KF30_9FUSO|nr:MULTISPECIES: nitrilase-related carbon-nitrogen hydrolase [Psychrilyobacter]MCS5420832.1 nitrilase [Psychrilyobacter sp. S5]NDI79124.1 nitrilase [Psychrilyobacter piezotolerans]RDE59766.1 nitrilase [Psychrilyobacter sp. S5]REI40092.1 nitrilase [Psychrilyobacter piezotolerans]
MKLAVAQINPTLGNVEKNKIKMISYIESAIKKGVELVVFPELSLTGYLLEELTFDVAGIPVEFYELSKKISILFGGVEESRDYYYYNSAFYLEDGKLQHTHRKVYLPTYGLFDEGRYLKSGNEIKAFDTKFGRFGILICEDAWHLSNPYVLSMDGADYVFTLVNSPSRGAQGAKLSPNQTWDEMMKTYSKLLTSFYIFAHRVGYEDGVNFFGGSRVYSPNGDILGEAKTFEEEMIVVDLDKRDLRRARINNPVMRDEKPELVMRSLKKIIG